MTFKTFLKKLEKHDIILKAWFKIHFYDHHAMMHFVIIYDLTFIFH